MPVPFSALALTDLILRQAFQRIIDVLTTARPGVLLTLLADFSRTHFDSYIGCLWRQSSIPLGVYSKSNLKLEILAEDLPNSPSYALIEFERLIDW